ncbi:FecR family protein [Butyricimonas virosa]|uniref:FecR family protein n=1 Tax=Butyricimonas virosa TaxID=544645 RepID=UPI00242E18A4|nr:FecR family protein [Butyricimonas virosa]
MKDYTRELKIAEILARQELEKINDEDREFLSRWLEEDEENAKLYQRLLQHPGPVRPVPEFDLDGFVNKTMRKVYRRRRRIFVMRVAAVAAVLIMGIFVALLFREDVTVEPRVESIIMAGKTQAILSLPDGRQIELDSKEGQETEWVKYAEKCDVQRDTVTDQSVDIKIDVARGGEYKVRLDDGTVVWLNSESSLVYPKQFAGDKRIVRLSGEAYFEVERDERKPFVVSVAGMEIKVLGTSFNIAAYEDEETITTTLVSGAVEVITRHETVHLTPGKQATVQSGRPGIVVSDVDPTLYSSWIEGVFKFDKMTLTDICTRLSRWYNVDFVFEGDTGNEKFTGGTWKYVSLEEFLSRIEKVTDVSFHFEDKTVIVRPKK